MSQVWKTLKDVIEDVLKSKIKDGAEALLGGAEFFGAPLVAKILGSFGSEMLGGIMDALSERRRKDELAESIRELFPNLECPGYSGYPVNTLIDWFIKELDRENGGLVYPCLLETDSGKRKQNLAELYAIAELHGQQVVSEEEKAAIRKSIDLMLLSVFDFLTEKADDNTKAFVSKILNEIQTGIENLNSLLDESKALRAQVEELFRLATQSKLVNFVINSRIGINNSNILHYTYRHDELPCLGRDEVLTRLDAFMNDKRSFLFWSITGSGGMGKSKLAYTLYCGCEKNGWKGCWITKDNAAQLSAALNDPAPFRYPQNVLFVCDYAGSCVEALRSLIGCLRKAESNRHIRLLMLERGGYGDERDTWTWYRQIVDTLNDKEFEYEPKPLDLDEEPLPREEQKLIVQNYTKVRGNELTEDKLDELVVYVNDTLFGQTEDSPQEGNAVRALFLLFTADAALNGKDYRQWDAKELLFQYLERTRRSWMDAFPDENVRDAAEHLLLYATVTGAGLNLAKPQELPEAVRSAAETVNQAFRSNRHGRDAAIECLCDRGYSSGVVTAMQPDLVGEFFALSALDSFSDGAIIDGLVKAGLSEPGFWDFLSRGTADWYGSFGETLDGLNDSVLAAIEAMPEEEQDAAYQEYAQALFDVTHKSSKPEVRQYAVERLQAVYKSNPSHDMAVNYAKALVNVTAKMTEAEPSLETAERIRDLLAEHPSSDMAVAYASALVNAAVPMTEAESRLDTAERIHDLLAEYPSPYIAIQYAGALFNATNRMTEAESRLDTAERIHDLLAEYSSPDIAVEYAKALVNATLHMTEAEPILETAERICDLLADYPSPDIAEAYAKALFNATARMTEAEPILETAERIRDLLAEHPSSDMAVNYAMALFNATAHMTEAEPRLAAAERIRDLLADYPSPDVAVWYAMALAVAAEYLTDDPARQESLIHQIKELAEQYPSDDMTWLCDRLFHDPDSPFRSQP